MNLCRRHQLVSWFFQIVAAVILAQTLFFKFTGAAESRHIFTVLGVEPWGRWGTGVLELVAAGLLLSGRWAAVGGGLGLGLMAGAVFSHLTRLGLVVQNDGGLLFGLAVTVLGACAIVVWLRRQQLPYVGSLLRVTAECPARPPHA
jgi:hypothetical protein